MPVSASLLQLLSELNLGRFVAAFEDEDISDRALLHSMGKLGLRQNLEEDMGLDKPGVAALSRALFGPGEGEEEEPEAGCSDDDGPALEENDAETGLEAEAAKAEAEAEATAAVAAPAAAATTKERSDAPAPAVSGGMRELDLETGQPKERPAGSRLNYDKWDALEREVEADEADEALYSFEQTKAEITVRVPLRPSAITKQVRVNFKRNWITVWAPARGGDHPAAAREPPALPLLDFQLYGAVDADNGCEWSLERGGGGKVNLLLELSKSPVYNWPTFPRENGLRSEAERAPALQKLAEDMEKQFAPPPGTVRQGCAPPPPNPPPPWAPTEPPS